MIMNSRDVGVNHQRAADEEEDKEERLIGEKEVRIQRTVCILEGVPSMLLYNRLVFGFNNDVIYVFASQVLRGILLVWVVHMVYRRPNLLLPRGSCLHQSKDKKNAPKVAATREKISRKSAR